MQRDSRNETQKERADTVYIYSPSKKINAFAKSQGRALHSSGLHRPAFAKLITRS